MAKITVLILVLSVNIYAANTLLCGIQSYNVANVNYILYNKNHPNGVTLAKDALLPDVNTIVLIHGWLENGNWPWMVETSKGYLNTYPEGINVICVDYDFYSQKNYLTAICVSERIGESVGRKLNELGLSPKIVSCTGHSLGAQICGSAGRFVFISYGEKFLQITGLDAAGPLFDKPPLLTIQKLQQGDAKVVVGVYTNGELLGFGAMTHLPYADYNFFVNGGERQPGCPIMVLLINWLTLDINSYKQQIFCSHQFSAHVVWAQLAAGSTYIGTLCPTYDELSDDSCTNNPVTLKLQEYIEGVTPGIYHIKTDELGKQI